MSANNEAFINAHGQEVDYLVAKLLDSPEPATAAEELVLQTNLRADLLATSGLSSSRPYDYSIVTLLAYRHARDIAREIKDFRTST